MSNFKLNLPTDIPWERICVSEDMMDTTACDRDRPAKWQSSIAAFKYVPEDDYQAYPGRKISYLKVVCSIGGYQPKTEDIEAVLSNWNGINGNEIEQRSSKENFSPIDPVMKPLYKLRSLLHQM